MKPKYRLLSAALAALTLLHPLSAHAESGGTFVWERDAWYFPNSPFEFHSAYRDNLFPEHEACLSEQLNNVEYFMAAESLAEQEFSGYCYGMAATSMLACYDIFNPEEHLEEFGVWADTVTEDLYSLRRLCYFWGMGQKGHYYEQSIIAYYQLLQNSDACRQASVA